jgi:hypothetical protein
MWWMAGGKTELAFVAFAGKHQDDRGLQSNTSGSIMQMNESAITMQ